VPSRFCGDDSHVHASKSYFGRRELVMKFVPPGEEERRRAIGSLEGMPPALRTLLQPGHAGEPRRARPDI
jgi:hypothetical protein